MKVNPKNTVAMAKPSECPKCGATAVDPCQKNPPKIDCVRDD